MTLDYAALQPLLEKLETALNRSNTGAVGIIDELRPLLAGTDYQDVLNKMNKAIGAYDFDAALAQLPDLASLA